MYIQKLRNCPNCNIVKTINVKSYIYSLFVQQLSILSKFHNRALYLIMKYEKQLLREKLNSKIFEVLLLQIFMMKVKLNSFFCNMKLGFVSRNRHLNNFESFREGF